MKNMWKLSNYLFDWNWKKWGKNITLTTIILGVALLLGSAIPTGDKKGYLYYAKSFRSYDMVVDQSYIGILFILGLCLLLVGIFAQIKGFSVDSKGMYTFFTLPMKRREVYGAFLLSAAAAMALYFLLWLILMVAAYFPIMGYYEQAAAKEVFYVSADSTVTGLQAHQNNGLFLAFQRSLFLSSFFPTSLMRALPLFGGLGLLLTGTLFAGFWKEGKGVAILFGASGILAGIFMILLNGLLRSRRVPYAWELRPLAACIILGGIAVIAAVILQVCVIRKLDERIEG